MSYIVSTVCVQYNGDVVLQAAALTMAMTIGLTVYAITTKSDFTVCGPLLFVLGFLFAMVSILGFFMGFRNNLFFACFGVFLFSFYLIYDTQIIVGGKHRKYQLEEDQYILGALILYLDIINLFLYILEILGKK